jgi:hypothetical protein
VTVVIAAVIGSACLTLGAVTLVVDGGRNPRGSDLPGDRPDEVPSTRPSPLGTYSVPDREVLSVGETFDYSYDFAGFTWDADVQLESATVEDPSPAVSAGTDAEGRVLVVVDVNIRVSEGELVGTGGEDFGFLPQGGELVEPERGFYPGLHIDGYLPAGSAAEGRIAFLVHPSDAGSGQVCLRDAGARREMRACWNLAITS